MVQTALERKLYVIRKTASHRIQALKLTHGSEYFVPSMSTRTVVYKGLLLADQVGQYYLDLQNEKVESAIAVVHQRFSTNTFPSWALAHPYRYIAHNGEINTVRGNNFWLRAREQVWQSPVLGGDIRKLAPIIYDGQSDTASLDNAIELMVMSGYSLAQAMLMLVPEAWEKSTTMDPDRRAFYAYHAPMMEAWDGPAAIVFTDGVQIGATLDRNGLRPARYVLTDDDTVVLASEVVKNMLDSEEIAESTYKAINHGRVESKGVEVLVKTRPVWNTRFTGGYTFTHAEITEGADEGKRPNELPRHTLTARVDWASGPFTAYVKSSSKFDMAVSNPGNKGSRNAPKYEDYTIVDIGGSWTPVKNHVIAWAVNNVLDKDTAVFEKSGTSSWANIYSNYIEGRNLWLSYTYSL